jgi:hypothetical protein
MKRYLALALIAGLCVTTAAATAGNKSFSDATGDSGTAPDLTTVEVTDTGGFVAFKIAATLVPSSSIQLSIDTDRDRATGDEHGHELWVAVFQEGDGKSYWDADRWNGTKWDDDAKVDVVSQTFPGREEIGFKAAEAGISGPFDFDVHSIKMLADAVEGQDHAPDSIVPWTYELAATRTATLALGQPRFTPARVVSGKALTVTVPVRGSAPTDGTTTCTVRVGARSAKGRGTAGSGWATCRLVVPKGSSGKTARGSILVSSGGASVTRTFTVRIA